MKELRFKEVEKTQYQTENCEARIWIVNFFSTPYSDAYKGKDKQQLGFLTFKMGISYYLKKKNQIIISSLRLLQNNFIHSVLHSTVSFEETIESRFVPSRTSGENVAPVCVIRALWKSQDQLERDLCRTGIVLTNTTLWRNPRGDQGETQPGGKDTPGQRNDLVRGKIK